jgi:hypothetical protein
MATLPRLAVGFSRLVAAVFFAVGSLAVLAPVELFAGDGIDFSVPPAAGRAELSGWYAGTAFGLALAFAGVPVLGLSSIPLRSRLGLIALVVGGFAASRLVSYARDGVDADPDLAARQNATFAAESVGCLLALLFFFMVGDEDTEARRPKRA